jgi:hypothetical protein
MWHGVRMGSMKFRLMNFGVAEFVLNSGCLVSFAGRHKFLTLGSLVLVLLAACESFLFQLPTLITLLAIF